MALVTLAKYKLAIGETSNAHDTLHQDALDDASAAVAAYSDRDLGVALTGPSDRTYAYDGSGFLEIDDASVVAAVRYETGGALATNLWEPLKDGPAGVPYSYVRFWNPSRVSSEMGFTFNLDTAIEMGLLTSPELRVVVTATWGWATVPNDIQRAVIWTATAYESLSERGGGTITSESVAEVARSYALQGALQANAENEDLPPRAKAILEKYRRHVL